MCIACAPHVQVPLFWLAFSSSLADLYGRSSTSLAIVNSRVAACMGLGYAVATLLGGKLSDVRRLLPRTDSNPNPNPSPNPNPDPNPHPHQVRGFKIKDVPGDNNCQFHALADQLE